MEIDAVAVLDMVFHAGADAAPERFGRAAVRLEVAGLERDIIGHHALLRVLRGEDVVVQGAFVKVGIFGRRRPLEEMPRQLQHVVGVAGFRRARAKMLAERARRVEMLAVRVAADGVSARVDDAVPEVCGGRLVFRVAGQFVKPRQADEFGDLRVAVQAGQVVFALRQRVKNCLLIKFAGQIQVFRARPSGIDVGQNLVHAAMFLGQHNLPLGVAEVRVVAMAQSDNLTSTSLALALPVYR